MRLSLACLAVLSPATALAEVPKVATDIPAVHALVSQVMTGLGEPTLLMAAGGDAHDYQMRPSEARALNEADILFWIGPEMTPWLERAVSAGLQGRSVELLDVAGTTLREFGEADGHGHDGDHGHDDHAHDEAGHDHDHEEAAGHDHDEEGHSHEGIDPHAWLDPANAALWLAAVAGALSEADPANAAAYAENASAEAARIAALDAENAAKLDAARGAGIAVFHDAYGYFAGHYGLDIVATVALGDAADPGAKRLSEVREALSGAVCIFPEAQHDPTLIGTVAEGTGVRVGGTLDPEGRDLPPGPDLYRQILGGLADTIAACVAGS